MKNRITPHPILSLDYNEVYVYSSNLSGIHGAGAANTAFNLFGAVWGQGIGHFGQSYGIPTKDKDVITRLSLPVIEKHVRDFIRYAKSNPDLIFYVINIGCNYAKYKPSDIAPMFIEARTMKNIYLTKEFWDNMTPGLYW